jgi:hypothetical protein
MLAVVTMIRLAKGHAGKPDLHDAIQATRLRRFDDSSDNPLLYQTASTGVGSAL